MSKRIRSSDDSSHLIDPDFATILEEEDHRRQQARGRHMEHKAHQLCRQVQRALNLALAGQLAGVGADTLFVSHVAPAPGCGHLLVFVVIPSGRGANRVLAELRASAPRLRAEVARCITRKRAPELSFVPVSADGEQYG